MTNLKISIITPSYNQDEFIERTIQSVLAQNYPNLEYIIIDGDSTDNTVDIIKKYDNRIAYWVSEPDKGQTDAINKGFEIATGDIVAWLNSDDTYEPEAVKTISEVFKCPEIDLIYGDCNIVDKEDKIIGKMDGGDFRYKKNLFNLICTIPQPATFFRRKILNEIGYLDISLNLSMDFEYWIRASKAGKKIQHIPKKIANYRWYEDAKSAQALSNNYSINENRIIQYKYNKLYYLLFGLKRNVLSPIKKAIARKVPIVNKIKIKKYPTKGILIFFNDK